MATKLKKAHIDCSTGEMKLVPLNARELAVYKKDQERGRRDLKRMADADKQAAADVKIITETAAADPRYAALLRLIGRRGGGAL